MFNIGDKVVYPMHGAGVIEGIEKKELLGEEENYYIIKMPVNDIKLMVPTKKAENIGVREVVSKKDSEEVFKILEKPKQPYIHDTNWSRRYNTNIEKIKSGDICEVAEVVRDLSHKHMERGLSIGEKKMLTSAKDILLSEMVLSQNKSHEVLDDMVEELIKVSYDVATQKDNDTDDVNNINT